MAGWQTGALFMRFTIRNLLWLAVLLALCAGWFYYACRLWTENTAVEPDTPPPDETISEYRELLDHLN
jgi:hypothetical protein